MVSFQIIAEQNDINRMNICQICKLDLDVS